jgi:hypothetical protein
MTDSGTFTALIAIKEIWGPGKSKDLTRANFAEFYEAMILAGDSALHGVQNGGFVLLASQDEWDALPDNLLLDGTIMPMPVKPEALRQRLKNANTHELSSIAKNSTSSDATGLSLTTPSKTSSETL